MKLSLVVMNQGKATGKTIPVTLSQFIIGRDPQCQLRPASALISKRHCAVIARGDKYYIRDFDSTNGTFVNTEPVKGERELKTDDVLAAGPLTFRVVIEGSPVPAKAPAPGPAPVAVSKQTPLPKNKPQTQKESDDEDDESIGDMMLDMADDGGDEEKPAAQDGTTLPEGMQVVGGAGLAGDTKTDAPPVQENKPAENKPADKKKGMGGDTSAAAMALLQKYMRRERS